MVTFHPATLEDHSAGDEMRALLDALAELNETHLIFTMPNADTGSRELASMVECFVEQHPNARAYTSLGQLRYLSCMQFIDGVVGNSSSGIVEAPSMGIGTINIGNRQKGRLSAASVIHCSSDKVAIQQAIYQLYDHKFRESLKSTINPYGAGGATRKILEVIRRYPLNRILKKSFYDLPEQYRSNL